MKKIFFSIVALAALAACTKSEVAYEASQEIGFAPTLKGATKAAMEAGTLPETQALGVWAYWNYENNAIIGSTDSNFPADYAYFQTPYLEDATFSKHSDGNWGGYDDTNSKEVAYPWPTNGKLVFAGYTKPSDQTNQTNLSVSYTLVDNAVTDPNEADNMVFTNYTQSDNTGETFDLCWFGRTPAYNNRSTGAAVDVTLSHALTWITFQVKGKDANSLPVKSGWKVTNLTLNDVYTTGTGTCVGTTTKSGDVVTPAVATWTTLSTIKPMEVYPLKGEAGIVLTDDAQDIESNEDGIVIIPQTPTSATIEWSYTVGDKTFTESKILPLTLSDDTDANLWKAGYHYTYTIVFDSNEILINPTYSDWAPGTVPEGGVTIQ